MAKKKDKRLGEDPFERFLPQIQDSRKKKVDDVNGDVNKNVDKDIDNDVSKNKTVDDDVSVDVNVNNDVNSGDDVSADEYVNDDVIDDVANTDDENINIDEDASSDNVVIIDRAVSSDDAVNAAGTITIQKKKSKSGDYARATYYLRPDQISTINRLHKDSGRDKSELVRMAIDILIERARVE